MMDSSVCGQSRMIHEEDEWGDLDGETAKLKEKINKV